MNNLVENVLLGPHQDTGSYSSIEQLSLPPGRPVGNKSAVQVRGGVKKVLRKCHTPQGQRPGTSACRGISLHDGVSKHNARLKWRVIFARSFFVFHPPVTILLRTHPDRVISSFDPGACHGVKSATPKCNGYRVHFTESTENKIITNLKVTPGNVMMLNHWWIWSI